MKVDLMYTLFPTIEIPRKELEAAREVVGFIEKGKAMNDLIRKYDPKLYEFMEQYGYELSSVCGTKDYEYFYEA